MHIRILSKQMQSKKLRQDLDKPHPGIFSSSLPTGLCNVHGNLRFTEPQEAGWARSRQQKLHVAVQTLLASCLNDLPIPVNDTLPAVPRTGAHTDTSTRSVQTS